MKKLHLSRNTGLYKYFRIPLALVAVLSFVLLSGFEEGGCGAGLDNRWGEPAIDVGGPYGAEWRVGYGDTIQVRVKDAGGVIATHNFSRVVGGTFELDGQVIDVKAQCARAEVDCPNEVFPPGVKMYQPGGAGHLLQVKYLTENAAGTPVERLLLGNVDSDWDVSIALGASLGTFGSCTGVSTSYISGHIESDGDELSPMGVRMQGAIVTSLSGGCLLAGSHGAAAGGLTVEFSLPYHADRL